ncbi:MAG: nucleoside permease [Bacteroidales bacterium]
MNIKLRLALMNFLQYFVWGAWLITIANYWFGTKHWSSADFGAVFSTMGIASLFMPTLAGIIADRWINAERIYGILHLLGAIGIFSFSLVESASVFFWVALVAMACYMPTIALANSIAYNTLKQTGYDVVKEFPPIRVWGTIGFITAMWLTNLTGNKASEGQFYLSTIAAIILGIFAFTLPACRPQGRYEKDSLLSIFGLDAFNLLKQYNMAIFFIFSMFLGAALQLTNMYGDVFLDDFKHITEYADSFVVRYSTIIMSISQISETLFILAIPFFLKRFGIKQVMIISMLAWVLRFGLFAYGSPEGFGLVAILFSCVVYGMAFDFFNISGSLFVENSTNSKIRSSSQGLFMMMTNGVGAILGSTISGWLIDNFFVQNGIKLWSHIWLIFAGYALIIAVLFSIFFKYKHQKKL